MRDPDDGPRLDYRGPAEILRDLQGQRDLPSVPPVHGPPRMEVGEGAAAPPPPSPDDALAAAQLLQALQKAKMERVMAADQALVARIVRAQQTRAEAVARRVGSVSDPEGAASEANDPSESGDG